MVDSLRPLDDTGLRRLIHRSNELREKSKAAQRHARKLSDRVEALLRRNEEIKKWWRARWA